MTAPRITVSGESAATIACDAVVIGAFKDGGGPTLGAASGGLEDVLGHSLEETLRSLAFKGGIGQAAVIPTMGRLPASLVVVAGLGPRSDADPAAVRRAAANAARKVTDHIDVALALHADVAGSAEAAAEGFLLGNYTFSGYKSDPKPSKVRSVALIGADERDAERAAILAEATIIARDLVNEPAGELTPARLADRARELADVGRLEATILDEGELEARGFGGILGVGRGSDEPPRLIELRYTSEDAKGDLMIVGKGVTFDSGGLSLKDGRNMMDMKTDMSGAAAVLGAMSALPRLTPRVNVTALIPAVENLPSGRAIKPGDVIRHYGGRTSEVLNTDAEGRLILADALAYASERRPDAIVDVATLTGAMVVALGAKVFGAFSTDDTLMDELRRAAADAGERMWPMPLIDAYEKDLESEVADCKNSAGRSGGSIFAALFLRSFLKDGPPWAHLDIAGPARAESDYDEVGRGGSGVATRTLVHWVEGRGR